jgi:hypothetical protein
MEWQPIESAPKDGRAFLAWCFDGATGEACAVSWDERAEMLGRSPWRVNGVEDRLNWTKPTHWMQLPDPPA